MRLRRSSELLDMAFIEGWALGLGYAFTALTGKTPLSVRDVAQDQRPPHGRL
jgi:hypothetical protein